MVLPGRNPWKSTRPHSVIPPVLFDVLASLLSHPCTGRNPEGRGISGNHSGSLLSFKGTKGEYDVYDHDSL